MSFNRFPFTGDIALIEAITDLAVECCDFSQMFQDPLH
jgi:hypothetical protein